MATTRIELLQQKVLKFREALKAHRSNKPFVNKPRASECSIEEWRQFNATVERYFQRESQLEVDHAMAEVELEALLQNRKTPANEPVLLGAAS